MKKPAWNIHLIVFKGLLFAILVQYSKNLEFVDRGANRTKLRNLVLSLDLDYHFKCLQFNLIYSLQSLINIPD